MARVNIKPGQNDPWLSNEDLEDRIKLARAIKRTFHGATCFYQINRAMTKLEGAEEALRRLEDAETAREGDVAQASQGT